MAILRIGYANPIPCRLLGCVPSPDSEPQDFWTSGYNDRLRLGDALARNIDPPKKQYSLWRNGAWPMPR